MRFADGWLALAACVRADVLDRIGVCPDGRTAVKGCQFQNDTPQLNPNHLTRASDGYALDSKFGHLALKVRDICYVDGPGAVVQSEDVVNDPEREARQQKLSPVFRVYQSTDHEYQEEKMGIIEEFETLAADYWQGRWENDGKAQPCHGANSDSCVGEAALNLIGLAVSA